MLRVDGLSFGRPGAPHILGDIRFDLVQGEHVALIGANGAGKSTLARCLNGLYLPTSGRVEVEGHCTDRPAELPAIRQLVGMVFQNPDDQLVTPRVEDEIAFGLENLALPFEQIHQRVEETLADFDLQSLRHRPPHHLSGGEKQRVALAAVIAMRPRYLVLDEPTALLAPSARLRLNTLLEQARRRHGLALLHITHAPEEAARAERILVLDRGRLWADGPSGDILMRIEALEGLGLDPPFAAALSHRLKRFGIPPNLHIEPLAAALAPRLRQQLALSPIPQTKPTDAPALLEGRRLTYTYDAGLPTQHDAISDLDISIARGGRVALVGSSGAGKSTLIQHLNGLLRPHTGTVHFDGDDIWSRPEALPTHRRRVALVFQFPESQFFAETLLQDVAYGPRLQGLDLGQATAAAVEALELVGLDPEHFGPRPPLSLSGGEQRRAALAASLAMRPQALILDEPTAGLDTRARREMTALLTHLNTEGTTLVFISHDMELVAELADRVFLLEGGRVQGVGLPGQLLDGDDAVPAALHPTPATRLANALRALGCQLPAGLVTPAQVERLLVSTLETTEKVKGKAKEGKAKS